MDTKLNCIINYLEQEVSPDNLLSIFKKPTQRSLFIWLYPFFGDDGNDDFYHRFINNNISSSNIKIQEDAIKLSIILEYYQATFLADVRKALYSRKNEFFKLSCIDWLLSFSALINKDDYQEINSHVFSKSKNELLKFQCATNLILADKGDESLKVVISYLNETTDPALFYRLLNSMDAEQLSQKITIQNLAEIKEALEANERVRDMQKSELLKRINVMESSK